MVVGESNPGHTYRFPKSVNRVTRINANGNVTYWSGFSDLYIDVQTYLDTFLIIFCLDRFSSVDIVSLSRQICIICVSTLSNYGDKTTIFELYIQIENKS